MTMQELRAEVIEALRLVGTAPEKPQTQAEENLLKACAILTRICTELFAKVKEPKSSAPQYGGQGYE